MSRIKTEELLERVAKEDFTKIRLTGLQDGKFYMMLEAEDGVFIHENNDGRMKEYPKVENALSCLKRKTQISKIEIDIALWGDTAHARF